MKRLLIPLLICCMLIPLYGCSGEPVAYSDRLMSGRNCYIDVVEIIPVGTSGWISYLYCQCVLSDGSSVWMKIDSEDYVAFFDAGADEYNLAYEAKKITYDAPVRLMGYAERDKVALDVRSDKEKSMKLFYFDNSVKSQTLQGGTRSDASIQFSADMKEDVHVYADILDFQWIKSLSWGGSSYISRGLCKGVTDDGEELWILISDDDYQQYFDSEVAFVSPARIYGLTAYSKEEINEAALPDGVPSVIICFEGVDPQKFESSKIINQPPIPYQEAEKNKQPVYIDVVELIPDGSQGGIGHVFYQCVLSDGSRVWMKIDSEDYISYFDIIADEETVDYKLKRITYDAPVRLIGSLEWDDVAQDVYEKEKTNTKLFYFKEAQKSETMKTASHSKSGIQFDENMRDDVLVYEDILTFLPVYTLSWFGVSAADDYICQSTTAEGKTLWVMIPVEDYELYFGSPMEFHSPARIYGVTTYAEQEMYNAESLEDLPSLLFFFGGVDPQGFESLKASNLPPVSYTGDEKIAQHIYVDITEIRVEHSITITEKYYETKNYVCRCKTTDGRNVWVHMTSHELTEHFMYTFETEMILSEPVRIHGHIEWADFLAQGLEDAIRQNTIIALDEVTKP